MALGTVPTVSVDISEEEYHQEHDEGIGGCRACGDRNEGAGGWCEPDARNYECAACGAMELYGLDELLLMGELSIDGCGRGW